MKKIFLSLLILSIFSSFTNSNQNNIEKELEILDQELVELDKELAELEIQETLQDKEFLFKKNKD